MELGVKIKKLRELKNYTQEYMAEELGMTQSAYSKIENGETDVPFKKLEYIAKILDVRPEDIIAFNEHVVFNVMHNQTVNGVQGSNFYPVSDEIKKMYEDQIAILKEEIKILRDLVERSLGK